MPVFQRQVNPHLSYRDVCSPTSCAYARRNPLAISVVTMENTTKMSVVIFHGTASSGGRKKHIGMCLPVRCSGQGGAPCPIAFAFSHGMLSSFSRMARAGCHEKISTDKALVGNGDPGRALEGLSEITIERGFQRESVNTACNWFERRVQQRSEAGKVSGGSGRGARRGG
jgi:hypothetical protein